MRRSFKAVFPIEAIGGWVYERQIIDKSGLDEIQRSIHRSGVVTPIILRKLKDGSHQGLAGFLRTTACNGLGISEVPAFVYSGIDDLTAMDICLIDNIQHSEMSDWDIAKCLEVYRENDLKLEEIATRIQKSTSYISQKLAVLEDSIAIQEAVETGELTEAKARYVRRLPEELHEEAIEKVGDKTVSETREAVKELQEQNKAVIIQAQIKELEGRIKEIDGHVKTREGLRSQVSEIEGKLKALQISNKEMNSVMRTVETLESDYFPLLREVEAYTSELKETKKLLPEYDVEELSKDRKAVDEEIAKLDVRVQKLRDELKKLKKDSDKLKKQRKIVHSKISEFNERQRKVRELTKLVEDGQKKLSKLEGKLGEAVKDYEKLKSSLEEYEQGILSERQKLSKQLGAVKKDIFRLNGKINNRTNVEKRITQFKEELEVLQQG